MLFLTHEVKHLPLQCHFDFRQSLASRVICIHMSFRPVREQPSHLYGSRGSAWPSGQPSHLYGRGTTGSQSSRADPYLWEFNPSYHDAIGSPLQDLPNTIIETQWRAVERTIDLTSVQPRPTTHVHIHILLSNIFFD